MSQGTLNIERNRGRKLSKEDLEDRLDLRRGSRTDRHQMKSRKGTRRAQIQAHAKEYA
jgi:hypothetical protein